MSDIEYKEKHEKRIQQKLRHMNRQAKIAKSHGQPFESKHEFAKHNALDCGNPRCVLCSNPRRTFKELTIQEKKFLEHPLEE
jgi:hypothetical protein